MKVISVNQNVDEANPNNRMFLYEKSSLEDKKNSDSNHSSGNQIPAIPTGQSQQKSVKNRRIESMKTL